MRYPPKVKLAMWLLNLVPLFHALIVVAAFWRHQWALAGAAVYLFPPLTARALQACWGRPRGRFVAERPEFLIWWASLQPQMLFARLPFLEELLRLVPGGYSAWLRLWGSRVGRAVYWAPGVTVLDRSYLEVGDQVVFGAGVRLNPHVLSTNEGGQVELALAPVRIGAHCQVGGYSLLTAGSAIAPRECPRAHLILPPFSVYEGGRRRKSRGTT